MGIGDLIAVRDDQEMLCGYGIVIEEVSTHFVRVYWFDEVMRHLNNLIIEELVYLKWFTLLKIK